MKNRQSVRFLTESTLGKLTKWLRLAGFDTRYDATTPDLDRLIAISKADKRIVLTRTQRLYTRLPSQTAILIKDNGVHRQARQIIRQLGLRRQDLNPLCRCVRCNQMLMSIAKNSAQGRVPDYIWQTHDRFQQCPQCRRIYWRGSHTQLFPAHFEQWFGNKDG